MKLGIVDESILLLAHVQPGGDETLFLIRSDELAAALRLLFEFIWERALPLSQVGTAEDPVEQERTELVLLMAAGMKDEVIAKRLGLSLRTVQRRISDLLRSLGVRTRFQAGIRAIAEGWLDADDAGPA